MREKELRIYENQKKHIIQFTRRPRKPEIKKLVLLRKTKREPEGYYNYAYDKSDGKPLKKKTKKKKQRKE